MRPDVPARSFVTGELEDGVKQSSPLIGGSGKMIH